MIGSYIHFQLPISTLVLLDFLLTVMLIILLIFALIRTLHGVPLSSPSEPPDPFPALALRDTQSHFGQRSVTDIVISCFATIFACTWSAAHPNIPSVTDSAWTRFKRQVTITICALLAPEMMTWWALEQHVGAKKIMNEYNKDINGLTLNSGRDIKGWFQAIFATIYGISQDSPLPTPLKEGKGPQWTMAHGFFLQMGGFMLCENGRPIQTLIDGSRQKTKDETKLIWNIQQEVIDPPRIAEEDIKDRSKGDAISKTFIILQTTWFVVQCIARWSQHLPVTELEVITLGFATLNGITYIAWWDKPQNVGRPVFLECKKPWGDTNEATSVEPNIAASNGASDDAETESNIAARNGASKDADTESNPLLQQTESGNESWLRRKLCQELEEHAHSWSLLWRLPSRILHALVRPLAKMTENDTVTKMRVGMFYSAENSEAETAYASFAIGALFGSVHLIPSWFLHFSSHQEMWFWRVSAIIITVEPVLGVLSVYYSIYYSEEEILGVGLILGIVFSVSTFIGSIFYPIARIILLILSLTALRSLPPGALQTIKWTTFIPHL